MKCRNWRAGLWLVVLLMVILAPFSAIVTYAADTDTEEVSTQSMDMQTAVETQIRGFADSIDRSDAADDAAWALASHGISGGGKKLSVGKNHALTATIFNSELMQVTLIESCAATIEMIQNFRLKEMNHVFGDVTWGLWEDSWGKTNYVVNKYSSSEHTAPNIECKIASGLMHSSQANAYDRSLEWMVSHTSISLSFRLVQVTENEVKYQVTCGVEDRFDFDTSQGSGFDKLISGMGALLFREFDWEAKVAFELTVPYSCSHSTAAYHWTYDSANRVLIPDGSEGYTENGVTRLTYGAYAGSTSPYYHQLDKPARLYHDKPWVMEYTVCNPGYFVLSPLPRGTSLYPYLMNYGSFYLFFQHKKIVDSQTMFDCYGTKYRDISTKNTYTFRLENMIDSKGNNVIYLTLTDEDSQTTILNKVPMDDYYENDNGVLKLQGETSAYLKGVDFFISYIGNWDYSFHADYFELTIWENGIEGGEGDYFTSKITKPTCAQKGYTTHTCALCGYSYKDSYTAKLSHTYSDWAETKAPACTEQGEESRKCAGCGLTENREIGALGHSYQVAAIPPTCEDMGYTAYTCHCGDSYGESYVDALGHSLGEWYENKTPTCEVAGERRRDCDRCDYAETEAIKATGHRYRAVVTKPTCTEQGYTTRTCPCGDIYTSAYTAALGHSYIPVVTAPTCLSQGYTTHTCICGDRYTDSYTDELGHSHEAVVTAPTCTEQGYTTHTCACGDAYVDSYMDALGHNMGDWYIAAEPTCTETGVKRRACARCDHFETDVISATGHSHNPVVTAPTCLNQGYTTHTCVCGDSYVDSHTDALGHAMQDLTCSVCGYKAVELEITTVTLRPDCAGLYYTGSFRIDEGITVSSMGIAVSASNQLPVADGSDLGSLWTRGATSVLISHILKANDPSNARRAAMPIYARAYAQLEDGTYMYGETVAMNLQQVAEAADSRWDTLDATQKESIRTMYVKFRDELENWNLPNLKQNT